MMTLCWALAASLMLTACFTGVESTKAITKKDVKRALEGTEEAVDAERGKMYSVAKASFAEWQPGKCDRRQCEVAFCAKCRKCNGIIAAALSELQGI